MRHTQRNGNDERLIRQYEYGDRAVIVADLPGAGSIDVDVVGETAIVVADHGDRTVETELELPGEAADVTTNNGVLTIEVEA